MPSYVRSRTLRPKLLMENGRRSPFYPFFLEHQAIVLVPSFLPGSPIFRPPTGSLTSSDSMAGWLAENRSFLRISIWMERDLQKRSTIEDFLESFQLGKEAPPFPFSRY